MIVRDLLIGPKRFSDLHTGLPKIPTNVLTTRLKPLEAAGVAARRALPRPAGGVVYELTPRGRELEAAVVAIGQWGAAARSASVAIAGSSSGSPKSSESKRQVLPPATRLNERLMAMYELRPRSRLRESSSRISGRRRQN